MSLDLAVLAAIAAMAVATAATRLAGLFVPPSFARSGRLRAAFEALPVAILSAIVAPVILAGGWPERLAGLAVILAALRLPLLGVIAIGVATAAIARALLPLA